MKNWRLGLARMSLRYPTDASYPRLAWRSCVWVNQPSRLIHNVTSELSQEETQVRAKYMSAFHAHNGARPAIPPDRVYCPIFLPTRASYVARPSWHSPQTRYKCSVVPNMRGDTLWTSVRHNALSGSCLSGLVRIFGGSCNAEESCSRRFCNYQWTSF